MGLFDFLSFRNEQPEERLNRRSRRRLRQYAGANQGRLFADFVGSSFSADSELRNSLPVLRNGTVLNGFPQLQIPYLVRGWAR